VNEEHLKKKRYQEICPVYSTARASVFLHFRLIRTLGSVFKMGVLAVNRMHRHHLNPEGLL
jgi:hypothetical protein